MNFNFKFGLPTKTIYTSAIVSILFIGSVTLVSKCTKIPEEKIYDIIDEVQRELPGKPLNEFIIKDPTFLNRRIIRDVDNAIERYESIMEHKNVHKIPAYVSEKKADGSKAQSLLGGEIRMCGSWVSDCPESGYNYSK
jgi:hypothetical protein